MDLWQLCGLILKYEVVRMDLIVTDDFMNSSCTSSLKNVCAFFDSSMQAIS